MPMELDIYQFELLKLGHGLPLYEPDPADRYDKVRVGDVGFVDRFGVFHPIFNIFRGRSDEINERHDTPADFVPLDPGLCGTFSRTPLPAGAMHSAYVRKLGFGLDTSSPCIPANATVKFSVSNQRGAALVIKYQAFREDILSDKPIKAHMLKHYRSWLDFIQNDVGCDINLNDMVLVTGRDLTAEWATATFLEQRSEYEVEFKVGDPALIASGSLGFWGAWQSSISVPHRCGPCPVRPPGSGDRAINAVLHQENSRVEGPNFNQCIFLRGYRIKQRRFLAPKVIKAGAGPEDLDADKDNDSAPVVVSLEQDYDDSTDDSPDGHDRPSFLNRKTNADIALVHDNDVSQPIQSMKSDVDVHQITCFLQKNHVPVEIHTAQDSQIKAGYIRATVPCQYRTGKILGKGTYAVVKEAVHIKTGKYYACKVINKKLMEGREYMVRNEIAVLKRVSMGHKNIVTLHDYFETSHNLYLCFGLCTGDELFDRICAKGNYYEADAVGLVRTVMEAVEYIHGCGIVHRDLKPENLLFRTKAEDADIMIADFGLSRIMDEDKLQLLTEICGTPSYMAPEIFKKSGHSKPVDIWAMGVITYFLLCGYTPFDRDTQEQEMQAIINGDYAFEPEEYWANVSETARDFVRACLTLDPAKRPTVREALAHPWLADPRPHFVVDTRSPTGGPKDLLPTFQKAFNARKSFRKAVFGVLAAQRILKVSRDGQLSSREQELLDNVPKYIQEAEMEHVDDHKEVVQSDFEDGSHMTRLSISPEISYVTSSEATSSLSERLSALHFDRSEENTLEERSSESQT